MCEPPNNNPGLPPTRGTHRFCAESLPITVGVRLSRPSPMEPAGVHTVVHDCEAGGASSWDEVADPLQGVAGRLSGLGRPDETHAPACSLGE